MARNTPPFPISVALCEVTGLDPDRVRAIWYSHSGYSSAPVITAEVVVMDADAFHVEMQEFEVVPRAAVQDVTAPDPSAADAKAHLSDYQWGSSA